MRRPRGFAVRLLSAVLAVAVAGWLGVRYSPAAPVILDAGPAVEPFDAPIHLRVSGLTAGEQITVQALSRDAAGGGLWESSAQFTADRSGTVDLAHTAPQTGSYQVADAAGLLWSLQPDYSTPLSARFLMGPTGYTAEVQVVVDGVVEAEVTLTRTAPIAAQELTVPQTGLYGSLFLPAHLAPSAAAVVVIGGSDGGEPALQAAALAAAGHPALALAYFEEPGLPSCLCSIPLEYFARAAAWLRARPGMAGRPVVLIGTSRGGEGALLIASSLPSVFDAVVAISPSDHINGPYGNGVTIGESGWTLDGRPLAADNLIPVDRIRVPVLMSAGGRDPVWDSSGAAASVMRQLDAVPGAPPHHYFYYPGAGHALAGAPPYFPLNELTLGGTQDADALAAAGFWPRMLGFIGGVHRQPGS